MIEAVIFDLDGTLIHLPINYEKLFEECSKIAKTVNVRPLTKMIPKLEEKTRKKLFEIWDKAELEALANMTVNDDGIALYKKFLAKPKVIVTMQGKAVVQKVLESLDLSFDFVITREYCLDRAQQLKIAAEKLSTSVQNILYIGNIDDDFFAAKSVGCQFSRVGK